MISKIFNGIMFLVGLRFLKVMLGIYNGNVIRKICFIDLVDILGKKLFCLFIE